MTHKNIFLFATALTLGLFAFAGKVNAQSCTTQYGGAGTYGGSTTCVPTDLTINKEVKNPISGVFVENLGTTDPTFSPNADVLYRLTIKNTSGETFNPVTVKDTLPAFLTFVAGPGTYDTNTHTLTFTLENLIAGETRTVEILARVLPVTSFPQGQSFFCVLNAASVAALNRADDDTAQICIQTNVLGTTTLPVAGFNDLVLLLPFAGLGLAGIALLKKKS